MRAITANELFGFTSKVRTLQPKIGVIAALRKVWWETPEPLKSVVGDLADDIENRATFSQALERYPKIFSGAYVGMIRAGENANALGLALQALVKLLELQAKYPQKVPLALAMVADLFRGAFVLSVQMKDGTPMIDAIDVARSVCTTDAYRKMWVAVFQSVVRDHDSFSGPMEESGLVPIWALEAIKEEEEKTPTDLADVFFDLAERSLEELEGMVADLEQIASGRRYFWRGLGIGLVVGIFWGIFAGLVLAGVN